VEESPRTDRSTCWKKGMRCEEGEEGGEGGDGSRDPETHSPSSNEKKGGARLPRLGASPPSSPPSPCPTARKPSAYSSHSPPRNDAFPHARRRPEARLPAVLYPRIRHAAASLRSARTSSLFTCSIDSPSNRLAQVLELYDALPRDLVLSNDSRSFSCPRRIQLRPLSTTDHKRGHLKVLTILTVAPNLTPDVYEEVIGDMMLRGKGKGGYYPLGSSWLFLLFLLPAEQVSERLGSIYNLQ
jgi:hypothetical protein